MLLLLVSLLKASKESSSLSSSSSGLNFENFGSGLITLRVVLQLLNECDLCIVGLDPNGLNEAEVAEDREGLYLRSEALLFLFGSKIGSSLDEFSHSKYFSASSQFSNNEAKK